jgi:5-methylcytosine-specific restriction endonuclease McrA
MTAYKYEVAISFAGEDRAFAEAVAKGLRDAGVEIFYDNFYAADLWGKDLSVELRQVYHESSEFCIMILSQHYVDKMWTSFERQQAIERLIRGNGKEYVLPVRLDGFAGEVPGLSGMIVYLSVERSEPERATTAFLEKIGRRTPEVATISSYSASLVAESKTTVYQSKTDDSNSGIIGLEAQVAAPHLYLNHSNKYSWIDEINFHKTSIELRRQAQWAELYNEIKNDVDHYLERGHGVFSIDTLFIDHQDNRKKWLNWLEREQLDWLIQNERFCREIGQYHWYRILVLPYIPTISDAEKRIEIFMYILIYIHLHLWHGVVVGVLFSDTNKLSDMWSISDLNFVSIPGQQYMFYIPAYYNSEYVHYDKLSGTTAIDRLHFVKNGLKLNRRSIIWLYYDECNFFGRKRLPPWRWKAFRKFFEILYLNNRFCEYCYQEYKEFDLDHIIPLNHEVPQTIMNFRPIHAHCNKRKNINSRPYDPFCIPSFVPERFQTLILQNIFSKHGKPKWINELQKLDGVKKIISNSGLDGI